MSQRCDIHTWRPVDGECATYDCECGATGYRADGGSIRAHKARRDLAPVETVRLRGVRGYTPRPGDLGIGETCRVPRLPGAS